MKTRNYPRLCFVFIVLSLAWNVASCESEQEQHISIDILFSERYPRWFEVQVLRLDDCPNVADAGLLVDGSEVVHRQTFVANEASDSVGELAPGRYSVLALGREDDCTPSYFDCKTLQVGQNSSVQLSPVAIDWYLEAGSAADNCHESEICDVELGCVGTP